jgi:hypothetical protein
MKGGEAGLTDGKGSVKRAKIVLLPVIEGIMSVS